MLGEFRSILTYLIDVYGSDVEVILHGEDSSGREVRDYYKSEEREEWFIDHVWGNHEDFITLYVSYENVVHFWRI